MPPHLRGLLIAGVRSGELGDLLDRFSEYLRVGAELKRKLWLSLAYPALTAGIALLFCLSVCCRRQFETIYRTSGIPLPG